MYTPKIILFLLLTPLVSLARPSLATRWCVTIPCRNNDPAANHDFDVADFCGFLKDHATCYVFQVEAPDKQDCFVHIQGYFELKHQKRLTWLKKECHPKAHFEIAKGTQESNYAYCTKLDTQIGEPCIENMIKPSKKSSKANKTAAYVKAIRKGATDTDLWDDFPSEMARLCNVPSRLRSLQKPDRKVLYPIHGPLPIIHVYYGEPGTGKSRLARDLYPDIYVLPPQRAGNMFLTPRGHLAAVVLIDDFAGDIPLKLLNIMLDPYPVEIELKGSSQWYMPHTVIITTNIRPAHWYPRDARQNVLAQVMRRISAVFDFDRTCHGSPTNYPETPSEFEARRTKLELPQPMVEAMQRMEALASPFKSPLKRGIPLNPADLDECTTTEEHISVEEPKAPITITIVDSSTEETEEHMESVEETRQRLMDDDIREQHDSALSDSDDAYGYRDPNPM